MRGIQVFEVKLGVLHCLVWESLFEKQGLKAPLLFQEGNEFRLRKKGEITWSVDWLFWLGFFLDVRNCNLQLAL